MKSVNVQIRNDQFQFHQIMQMFQYSTAFSVLKIYNNYLSHLVDLSLFVSDKETSTSTSGEDDKHFGDGEGTFFDAEEEDADMRRSILNAALEHVPEFGWSSEAIEAGAQTMGLSAMAEGMFPRGAGDLVLHFTEDCNVRLADYLISQSRVEKDPEESSANSG